MFVVGLTGGFASGKTLASTQFAKLGIPILDTDIIARELTLSGTSAYQDICVHFGDEYLQPDGELARFKLRERIFQYPEDKLWLENLLHPQIFQRVKTALPTLQGPYCIIVIPLLAESYAKYKPILDRILVIDLPIEQQIQRAYQREAISPALAEKIILSQARREKRLAIADNVIENHSTPEAFIEAITHLHEQYLLLAKT